MADKIGTSALIQLPWMEGVNAGENARRPYFDFKANGCSTGWYIVIGNDTNIGNDRCFTIVRYDSSYTMLLSCLTDSSSGWQISGSVLSKNIDGWYSSIKVARLKYSNIFPEG